MGACTTSSEIVCPKCGHTDNYYYTMEMNPKTLAITRITEVCCSKCLNKLHPWQERKFIGDNLDVLRDRIENQVNSLCEWAKTFAKNNGVSLEWVNAEIKLNVEKEL